MFSQKKHNLRKMLTWKTGFGVIIFVLRLLVCVRHCHAFDIEKDLVFRLYTREEPGMYYALKATGPPSISDTTFNSNRPTRIFVHGYKSKEKVINRYKEAYLTLGDYNFIAVDWISGASTYNYFSAKGRVQPVSDIVFFFEKPSYLFPNSVNEFKEIISIKF